MCKTDADIKLYTSVNYCIAIAETKTQAEKEWEARFQATVTPAGSPMPRSDGVRMIGVMLPTANAGSERPRPRLRVVPKDLDAYEIPEYLRRQEPDNHDKP